MLSLEAFCARYELSATIYDKLKSLQVTGPHSLKWILTANLLENGFALGEVGDICHAQERWLKGDTGIW